MNSLVRQDPWSLVPRLQDEINRLFGNQNDSSSATATWVPAVDVHENTDRFEFYVVVPGIDPSKVDLTLEGGGWPLSGQRAEKISWMLGNDPLYSGTERGQGHFSHR